jgi:hypothetical protein
VVPRLLLAVFLVAHGLVHLLFFSPPPPATAGGPTWPFALDRSWVLTPLGVGADMTRILGIALVALTIAGFALAAIVALGLLPSSLWVPAVAIGAVASLAVLGLFYRPWLTLGVAIDVVLLWAVLVQSWAPASLEGS